MSTTRPSCASGPAMVYELLSLLLARRLPGVAVDDEAIRDAAARIFVGVPAL